MPFAFSGETRNHESPKPSAQPRLASRLGRIFVLLAFLSPSACVSKKTHIKAVDEAYSRGADEVERNMRPYVTNLERALEAEKAKAQPRDEKGRFIKVNGKTVDLDGK